MAQFSIHGSCRNGCESRIITLAPGQILGYRPKVILSRRRIVLVALKDLCRRHHGGMAVFSAVALVVAINDFIAVDLSNQVGHILVFFA